MKQDVFIPVPRLHPQLIVVIADDITGAAEIAGIGLQFGLRIHLILYTKGQEIVIPEPCDMLVLATDTRSMEEKEAEEETIHLARELKRAGCGSLFKKTDSVLRGHIIVELQALMKVLDIPKSLLLPQNPSRERMIKDGKYYIGQKPLHKTPFANDPEFPAITSYVAARLGIHKKQLLPIGKNIINNGIYVAEASQPQEIMQRASELNEQILPAGGADFFTAYLIHKGYTQKATLPNPGLKNKGILIVLGSTTKHPIFELEYIKRNKIPACNTPRILFYREAPRQWLEKIKRKYAEQHSLILHTSHSPKKGKQVALNLRQEIAKAVETIYSEYHPHELIIEGGATACSILKRLGWNMFDVQCEVSPGVIRLIPLVHPETTVTLKPGSYPWGELFQ